MFQFGPQFPRRSAPQPAATGPALSHRAFLAWGEHCVECALPACYQTCDLYDPTPALKCRRFVDGIVPQAGTGSTPGGEVRFRKWAKLETRGSVAMLPTGRIDFAERVLTYLSPLAARLGKLVYTGGGGRRWLVADEAIHARLGRRWLAQRDGLLPDVFVADITNPGPVDVTLILTATVDKARMARAIRADQLPPPASVRIDVPPGTSQHELDVSPMRALFQSGLPFNLAITPENDATPHLVFHRLDLGIRQRAAKQAGHSSAPAPAKDAKLVIFDLDNTLWRGVLLEGDVTPLPGLRTLFEALDQRGILLSVASKNSADDALAKLAELGLAEFLLYPQIGWGPKSDSVRRIIQAIDIGADTVLFIDDNPFERAEVAGAVPGVEVLPETVIAGLNATPRLKGATTPEAKERRKMYQQAMERETAASHFGADYLEFLRNCAIRLTIRRDRPDDFDRIAELVQRTNQLNFSGRKYAREETAAILQNPGQERYVIECADRFGSYGTVGFCLIERQPDASALLVQDFMLSCRVQGKFVEQAMLHTLAQAGPHPVETIKVAFRKTDRNKAAQMVLEQLGFTSDETGEFYARDYQPDALAVDFMTIEG